MEKLLTQKDIKPLIKETIIEMIKDNKEEMKEIINEVIEDMTLANVVREGRKNDYLSEKRIFKILEK